MRNPVVGDRVRVTNKGVYHDVRPVLNEIGTIDAVYGVDLQIMVGIIFDNEKFGKYSYGGFVARQLEYLD